MAGRVLPGVLAALMLGAAALLAGCASQSAFAPVEPPSKGSFDPGLVAKGAQLAAIGNCISCHTAKGGKSYAGGRALKTPFGTIYGTNITPDAETGIGRWSEAAFERALREGLDREGRHLYPAFPYDHFTRIADEDIKALHAFIMTREPVRAQHRRHELSFPFNVRSLIGAWKSLYFEPGRFQPDPVRSARWNRGAYLAEGLGHCSACHTPRNFLGAEKKQLLYAGGEAEGWHGPALNAASPSPVPWTAEQLHHYGLVRVEGEEPGPQHAWAHHCWITNCLTFNNTFHSDHHLRPQTPYYELHAMHGAPRLQRATSRCSAWRWRRRCGDT